MIQLQSPVIISASRASDIPALYGDQFLQNIKEGFIIKRNPFNGKKFKISFDKVQLIVFWTKDPKPFIDKLETLNKFIPNYYFQFSLNNYNKNIESQIPDINKRIDTFIELSERIGKEKVIWRFDPLLLTDKINTDILSEKIETIAEHIHKYTNKLVFSFIDIKKYKRVQSKIKKSGIKISEFNHQQKKEFVLNLTKLNLKYNLELATCAEEIDFSKYGIKKNKCIDNELIKKIFYDNKELMNLIDQKKNLKDRGQRKNCACIISKDIGQYNTCTHSCVYCYAVTSAGSALNNYRKYLSDPKIKNVN